MTERNIQKQIDTRHTQSDTPRHQDTHKDTDRQIEIEIHK